MGKNNRNTKNKKNNKKNNRNNRNNQAINDRNKTDTNSNKKSIKGFVIGIIACLPFLAFGIALIGANIHISSSMKSCTEETTGIIGEVSVSKKMRRATKFWYIHRTYTADCTYVVNGEKVVEEVKVSKEIKKGQRVKIRYNPDDPSEKYIVGYDDSGVLILLIFGLVWSGFILLIMFALINALIYRKTGVDLLIKLQNLRKHKETEKDRI